jgi:hypothetical protein
MRVCAVWVEKHKGAWLFTDTTPKHPTVLFCCAECLLGGRFAEIKASGSIRIRDTPSKSSGMGGGGGGFRSMESIKAAETTLVSYGQRTLGRGSFQPEGTRAGDGKCRSMDWHAVLCHGSMLPRVHGTEPQCCPAALSWLSCTLYRIPRVWRLSISCVW